MKKTLIIGYGNTLRSDDGAGVWIADRMNELNLHDVEIRTCHQLHLELVPDLVNYARVIFVDASASGEPITLSRCVPSTELPSPSDHHVEPETLQQLALELYQRPVEAYLCKVAGNNFEFGMNLSPETQRRAAEAVERITAFVQQAHQDREEVAWAQA